MSETEQQHKDPKKDPESQKAQEDSESESEASDSEDSSDSEESSAEDNGAKDKEAKDSNEPDTQKDQKDDRSKASTENSTNKDNAGEKQEAPKVEEKKEEPLRKFELRVFTGTCLFAGTDSNVYLELYGTEDTVRDFVTGSIKESPRTVHLRTNAGNFERASEDIFQINLNEHQHIKGDLSKLVIWTDNSGLGLCLSYSSHCAASDWFLDKLRLEDLTSKKSYWFGCNRWINKKQNGLILTCQKPEQIYIVVPEARDLVETRQGRGNPWVKVEYGTQEAYTHIELDTTNPLWDCAVYSFNKESDVKKIRIQVRRGEFGKDKSVGQVEIDLSPLGSSAFIDSWFTMEKSSKRSAACKLTYSERSTVDTKSKDKKSKKEKSSKKEKTDPEDAKKEDSKDTKTDNNNEADSKNADTKEDKEKETKTDTKESETKDDSMVDKTSDVKEDKKESKEDVKEEPKSEAKTDSKESETKEATKDAETKSENNNNTETSATKTNDNAEVKESKKETPTDKGKRSKTVKLEKKPADESPSGTQRKKMAKQRSQTLQPIRKNPSADNKDGKPAEKKPFNLLSLFKKHEPEFQPNNLREVKDRPRGYVGKLHVKIFYGTGLPDDRDGAVYFDDDDTLSHIKTGDLLAFCGVSPLSAAIKIKTNTPFSHVAIAARIPDPKVKGKDAPLKLMLFESTNNSHDVPDYMDGTVRRGMTVFELKHRLHHIDSMAIWHIPLKEALTKDQSKSMLDWLWSLHKKQIKYDKLQLIPFWFNIGNKEDLKEMFCSEMVASALRAAKQLPSNANPSNYSPCGVTLADCFDQDESKHRILKYEVLSDRRIRFL